MSILKAAKPTVIPGSTMYVFSREQLLDTLTRHVSDLNSVRQHEVRAVILDFLDGAAAAQAGLSWTSSPIPLRQNA